MECFYLSDPKTRDYRKRMHVLWNDRGMFNVTEQRRIDQKFQIVKKQWLSSLELEEIQRNVDDAAYGEIDRLIVEEGGQDSERTATGDDSEGVSPQIEHDEQVDWVEIKDGAVLTEEDREILKMMMEIRKKPRTRLPLMRGVDCAKLIETVKKVDSVLGKLEIDNITDTNDTICYGAAIVCEILGAKNKKIDGRKEPRWKKRLVRQIKEMSKDFGRVNSLIDKRTVKKRHQDALQRKYGIKQKGLQIVIEEIRQKIKAKTAKISRYQQRINQYQHNRMFKNNESRFYQKLNNDEGQNNENAIPDADESKRFWSDIWGKEVKHNVRAEWLNDFKQEMGDIPKQQRVEITEPKLKKLLRKIPNWKAPGPDGLQGFWLKNFTSMHTYLTQYLAR